MRTAVILSASTNGLGAVRSLYREGVPTIAVALNAGEPVLLSRLPKRKLVLEGAEDQDSRLLDLLGTIGDPRPVLIPTSDRLVSFMIKHRRALAERFDFCLPDDDLTALFIDKARETEEIAALGLPLPKTVQKLPERATDLSAQMRFPIIVKPRSFEYLSTLNRKNIVLSDERELASFYEQFGDARHGLLAQEVIPGGDENLWVCNCSVGRSHELLGAFVFRRLRLSPPHYGVTSYAVSERNPAVVALVERLASGLGYVGSAMVEFKYDARDRQFKYIELNPRLGLCNYFDTVCGVNNVFYAYQLAVGLETRRTDSQRDGVMYLSAFDDLYSRRQDGEPILSALGHYLSNAGRLHVGAHFTFHDPWPAIVVAYRDVRRVFAEAGQKQRGQAEATRVAPLALSERKLARGASSPRRRRVLVLGEGTRAFLSVVRSLGRLGLEVDVAGPPMDAPALSSRYVARIHRLPPNVPGDSSWLDAIAALMGRERFDLVIPCHDPSILPLQQHRERVEAQGQVYLLEPEAFTATTDKFRTVQLATELGVPVPRSVLVRSAGELLEAGRELGFPLVVKPRSSFELGALHQRRAVQVARTPADLEPIDWRSGRKPSRPAVRRRARSRRGSAVP